MSLNKYEAVDVLFRGGAVKEAQRDKVVTLDTIKAGDWPVPFKDWTPNYTEVKLLSRDEAIERLLRGKKVKHLSTQAEWTVTAPCATWPEGGYYAA